MNVSCLSLLLLERLAEMRRRGQETALKVQRSVTYALNSGGDQTSGPPPIWVRLLDEIEPYPGQSANYVTTANCSASGSSFSSEACLQGRETTPIQASTCTESATEKPP